MITAMATANTRLERPTVEVDGTEESPPAEREWLLALPSELHMLILRGADERTLVNYAERTSHRLSSLLRGWLQPLWLELNALLLRTLPPGAVVDDAQAYAFGRRRTRRAAAVVADNAKALFVRTRATLQQRCPRCGQQKRVLMARARADGGDAAEVLDVSRYMHLCDWLLPTPRAGELVSAVVLE